MSQAASAFHPVSRPEPTGCARGTAFAPHGIGEELDGDVVAEFDMDEGQLVAAIGLPPKVLIVHRFAVGMFPDVGRVEPAPGSISC